MLDRLWKFIPLSEKHYRCSVNSFNFADMASFCFNSKRQMTDTV